MEIFLLVIILGLIGFIALIYCCLVVAKQADEFSSVESLYVLDSKDNSNLLNSPISRKENQIFYPINHIVVAVAVSCAQIYNSKLLEKKQKRS